MSLDIKIDRDDVIATYHRGPEFIEAYELAGSTSSAEVAGITGVNARTVRAYAKTKKDGGLGKKPQALKGIEYLESVGLLPMNLEHAKFLSFNLLASMTYWRGSIGKGGSCNVNAREAKTVELVSDVLEHLGCTYSSDHTTEIVSFDERVGRMLRPLGHKRGDKIKNLYDMPKHVTQAFNFFNDATNDPEDRAALAPLLMDFLLTMLHFRLTYSKSTPVISLNAQATKDLAETHAELVQNMIEKLLGNLKVNIRGPFENRVSKKDEPTGTYGSQLILPWSRDLINEIRETYPARIRRVISK